MRHSPWHRWCFVLLSHYSLLLLSCVSSLPARTEEALPPAPPGIMPSLRHSCSGRFSFPLQRAFQIPFQSSYASVLCRPYQSRQALCGFAAHLPLGETDATLPPAANLLLKPYVFMSRVWNFPTRDCFVTCDGPGGCRVVFVDPSSQAFSLERP